MDLACQLNHISSTSDYIPTTPARDKAALTYAILPFVSLNNNELEAHMRSMFIVVRANMSRQRQLPMLQLPSDLYNKGALLPTSPSKFGPISLG